MFSSFLECKQCSNNLGEFAVDCQLKTSADEFGCFVVFCFILLTNSSQSYVLFSLKREKIFSCLESYIYLGFVTTLLERIFSNCILND